MLRTNKVIPWPEWLESTQDLTLFSCNKKLFRKLKGRKTWFAKNQYTGLPWWLSGQESASQCRRHQFHPRSGKIPRAAEQLSPGAMTTESALWSPGAEIAEPMCPRLRPLKQEKPPRWETWPPQPESNPRPHPIPRHNSRKARAAANTPHGRK